jgi:hypothetical protein
VIFINILNVPKYAEGSNISSDDYVLDEIITLNMLKGKFITILPNLPSELSKLGYDTSAQPYPLY